MNVMEELQLKSPEFGTYKEFGANVIPRIVKQGKALLCSSLASSFHKYFWKKQLLC